MSAPACARGARRCCTARSADNFRDTGSCRFGDQCRYSHDEGPEGGGEKADDVVLAAILRAQASPNETTYEEALAELRGGRKQSHWIWCATRLVHFFTLC